MSNEQEVFHQPVKNELRAYDNIRKTAIDQGDDYTNVCLLDHHYFNKYYTMIAINLSKQQALDADPKPIEQINFIRNVTRNPVGNTAVFFIIKEAKGTIFDFSQGTVKSL